MLARKLITDQILRLSGLAGWDRMEKQAKAELADTLQVAAKNEYHAKTTINGILASAQWVPTPADLREAAESARTTPEPPGSGGCERCEHTGRRTDWYLVSTYRHPSGAVKRRTPEVRPPCW